MLDLNTIHEGCCLQLMQDIPAGSVDMILCDLPYGTTACKWDTIIPFDKLWEQYERIIKPNGAIVLTAAQPFTSALVMSNPKWFRYELIWRKVRVTGHLNAKKMPLREHESVLAFYKSLPTYNPQMSPSEGHIRGPRGKRKEQSTVYGAFLDDSSRANVANEFYPRSTIEFRSDMQPVHPTQKPVALFEYLIRTYTNPGEVVLDNCAGSFTTALAAENTSRRWICIEQEAKYCEIGRTRLAARTPALFSCP